MRALLRPLFILSLLLLLVPCLEAVAERRPPVNSVARRSVVVEYKRAYARPSQSLLGKLFGKRKAASHSRRHRSLFR